MTSIRRDGRVVDALVLKTSVPRGTGGSNPSSSAETPETSVLRWFFYVHTNEACFSEQDGHKIQDAEGGLFSLLGNLPSFQGSFERSKNPSHQAGTSLVNGPAQ